MSTDQVAKQDREEELGKEVTLSLSLETKGHQQIH